MISAPFRPRITRGKDDRVVGSNITFVSRPCAESNAVWLSFFHPCVGASLPPPFPSSFGSIQGILVLSCCPLDFPLFPAGLDL